MRTKKFTKVLFFLTLFACSGVSFAYSGSEGESAEISNSYEGELNRVTRPESSDSLVAHEDAEQQAELRRTFHSFQSISQRQCDSTCYGVGFNFGTLSKGYLYHGTVKVPVYYCTCSD